MNEARCPLVREIEEAAASCPHGPGTHPTAAQVDAYFITVDNVFWPRLRAALEASTEMERALAALRDAVVEQNRLGATWHPEVFGKMMSALGGANDALARYRAATRGEQNAVG